MHYKKLILAALVMPLAVTSVQAADVANGKAQHDKNCTGCHDSTQYTRANRKVSSLDGLKKQVRRCELSLGLQWFDDDVDDVIEYLNTSFYTFK